MTTGLACYRHPDRVATLRCTRCERPICVQDAVDAPVGFLCPDDARQPARVRAVAAGSSLVVTRLLVGVLVGIFLVQQAVPQVQSLGITFGPAIAAGEWWRTFTGAFLHAGLVHVGFNAYLLHQLGQLLEPALGRARFVAVYVAGLAGGAVGVLLLSWDAPTLGASGAVFGLMGAAMALLRRRGIDPWRTSIGSLVLLNLVITFVIPGISIGGHVGGLLGGAAAGWLIATGTGSRGLVRASVAAGALSVLALLLGDGLLR